MAQANYFKKLDFGQNYASSILQSAATLTGTVEWLKHEQRKQRNWNIKRINQNTSFVKYTVKITSFPNNCISTGTSKLSDANYRATQHT